MDTICRSGRGTTTKSTHEGWISSCTYPGSVLPPHEDPPCTRDYILPRASYDRPPKALEWLRVHPSSHAFATNRFHTTQNAIAFVEQTV